jgi:hypothetical protein
MFTRSVVHVNRDDEARTDCDAREAMAEAWERLEEQRRFSARR